MNLAIDLSPLQGPHRMRGIGYTVIHLINSISDADRKNHHFIFYLLPYEQETALNLLDLEGIDYEIHNLQEKRRITRRLPGRLNLIISVFNQLLELKDYYFGDSRIPHNKHIDVILQCDQSQPLPRKSRTKRALIIYDVIPYVLVWNYLWSYEVARVRGYSRKAALRCAARRWLYIHKLRVNTHRANLLLSISEQTKKDFITAVKTPAKKIIVTPLGVPETAASGTLQPHLRNYVKTSWGYMLRDYTHDPEVPFLFFVGGADRRRKLEDLVSAFNHLRAQNHNLKLILAGDSMQGPDNNATEEIQYALKTSSYLDDIVFLGFVDDKTRDWLYKNSLAFVYPSRYEGFGLPVLEAFAHGATVMCYDNQATREVAGNLPIYVNNAQEIFEQTLQILAGKFKRPSGKVVGEQLKKYSWHTTARHIIKAISSL